MGNVVRSTTAPQQVGGGFTPVRSLSKGAAVRAQDAVNMSASYATGGDTVALPPATDFKGLQLTAINILTPFGRTPNAGRLYQWNGSRTAPKIIAIVSTTGAEVGNGTDLSAVVIDLEYLFEM